MSWTSSISSTLFGWFSSFIFWFILAIIFLVVSYGFLALRKKFKLKFPVLEKVELGGGKMCYTSLKGGWFKSKSILGGLYDYSGEEVFKTNDNRQVQDLSSEDYHDVFGKRGVVCFRKGDDPKVLLPISRETLDKESRRSVNSIAPADFRDTANRLNADALAETSNWVDKYAPMLILGTMGVIFFISIIMIVQMVKQGQTEAKDLILQAGKYAESCKSYINQLPSTAP